jgi:hypothetical protein
MWLSMVLCREDRSLTVNMPTTVIGMPSKLTWNAPRCLNERVKYAEGGDAGTWKVKP